MGKLFIIDCKRKGNVIRFYLGNDPKYHGDDWNDYPYENNASFVYEEFILGYKDIIFPFEFDIFEPKDIYEQETAYCRNDFKQQVVPCIVVVSSDLTKKYHLDDFQRALGYKDSIKYYFGDEMVPDALINKDNIEEIL